MLTQIQHAPRLGNTSTHSPAASFNFSSCTTRKQLLRTTAPISPEPSQCNRETVGSPLGQVTRAGRKCVSAARCSMGCTSLALNSGNGSGLCPLINSIAGTTSSSHVTIVETGFPGSPNTGFPLHQLKTAG